MWTGSRVLLPPKFPSEFTGSTANFNILSESGFIRRGKTSSSTGQIIAVHRFTRGVLRGHQSPILSIGWMLKQEAEASGYRCLGLSRMQTNASSGARHGNFLFGSWLDRISAELEPVVGLTVSRCSKALRRGADMIDIERRSRSARDSDWRGVLFRCLDFVADFTMINHWLFDFDSPTRSWNGRWFHSQPLYRDRWCRRACMISTGKIRRQSRGEDKRDELAY